MATSAPPLILLLPARGLSSALALGIRHQRLLSFSSSSFLRPCTARRVLGASLSSRHHFKAPLGFIPRLRPPLAACKALHPSTRSLQVSSRRQLYCRPSLVAPLSPHAMTSLRRPVHRPQDLSTIVGPSYRVPRCVGPLPRARYRCLIRSYVSRALRAGSGLFPGPRFECFRSVSRSSATTASMSKCHTVPYQNYIYA